MAKKEIVGSTAKEAIANFDRSNGSEVESRIFTIRGIQVILDRDLAELYGVKTYRLNEQVKRNIKRFPERYRFQLTEGETNELIANCDRFKTLKHSSFCPYAFTEHGVVMLSSVLHSDEAIVIIGVTILLPGTAQATKGLVANSLIHCYFLKILGAKWNEDFQQCADYQTDTDQHECVAQGDARSGPGMTGLREGKQHRVARRGHSMGV